MHDVLASGVTTWVNASQDEQGAALPGWLAYPLETGDAVGSIAAGTHAVAGVVGGAVAGLSVAGRAGPRRRRPGSAAGGVVAYGVGDDVAQLHGGLSASNGASMSVLGIATDFGAAGVGTWDDTKQLAGDIGGTAKSAWHGITSLF